MGRERIEHTATTTADAATVYALLRTVPPGPVVPRSTPSSSSARARTEPEGIGAVRVFRSGKVTGRDTIVELVQDRRLAYTHVSSLPIKNYRADVDLTPTVDGTEIRWVSAFNPKIPGTGRLMRKGLDGFVDGLVNGLAEHATATQRSESTV